MPETTKTYANMEILQGADYTITITLDDASNTQNKNYLLTICKDFTGFTNFSGSTDGNGSSSEPYRAVVTETNAVGIGLLTAPNNINNKEIAINLYAVWTESLADDFDGYWELAEKNTGVSPATYTRIAQGEIYVSESASRYASTSA